ncbi:hypothetical protein SAMD00019534_079440 [Acytostelium subglobosum LB1]|uniref:hypothetical protein n=1 Tax=Acytostelium subglobosum LB1 TaxID=1410327 RepID=UPI0006450722|nr:hypothetical protein SAMD00019534_079440 [Acytostelium subglobosum LB1]GAM24769.1 hypothetical protein SAMD00019534_079440 [Acytostelium subglobosum LB1]|eukprot:XP_012752438.1 hypothetical protein SAMD00019534_079440 [Acytostelium subglobosum LB1]
MSTPTLYYFDGRARGEVSRLLFAYAGKKFVDTRGAFPLEEELRAKTPFGQLPYYVDDNIQIAQSVAIEFYLADQLQLAGSSTIERAQILQYTLLPADLYAPYFPAYLTNNEAALKLFTSETAPKVFAKLETLLVKAGGAYLVGNKLSWADISIFNLLDFFHQQPGNLIEVLKPFPALLAFHKQIAAVPQFAEYLKNRPTTIF